MQETWEELRYRKRLVIIIIIFFFFLGAEHSWKGRQKRQLYG